MIIVGFTGQLRGWWDNYLSVEEKATVINSTAVDEGVDNIGMALVKGREDVVYTLILIILEYFNGVCTQEGLNLCNELKLSRHLKIVKFKEKSQLGDFCTQFGLPRTSTQSKKKKKNRYHRYPNPDSPYKKKRSRYRSKEERDTRKAHRKSTRFTKNRSNRDLADIKCYKCGRFGHITPNCKLQKLKALELGDGLHDKVYYLLYTSGSDSDYTYSETESEAEVDLIHLSESSKDLDNTCAACKELLKEIIDEKIRKEIINLTESSSSSGLKLFE
uniref:CCHC-type domain-containing protein n=1 Tax=Nicotiana tabacum TaxID=4097 RepID=A0A1S4CXF6_TOBAC|nr:PREDICTED: uncharacterized protein LOC107823638 [Nicotiana tabacum]